MVRLSRAWVRCGRRGVEDHHVLTRARGGGLLDEDGEIYHHLALCPSHHRMVDDMGHESGLIIQGYAYRDGRDIVYQGPDAYLSERYPPPRAVQQATAGEVHMPVVQDQVRGSVDDYVARGAL